MNIILSIDYEIFGDGSGSMDACMLKPLHSMLRIAEQYHALLSIFAETLEIQALLDSEDDAEQAQAVCQQLQQACRDGHDIQLHLHPQWQGADVNTSLKADQWRIGDVSKSMMEQMISEGKHWLEDLLQPVRTDYQCIAFRAGGWCIQPSAPVIGSLQDNGIMLDSTVAPGARNSARADWYDFRDAPANQPWWRVNNDVLQPSSTGIYELPITTGKISRLKHLGIILNNMYHDSLAPNCTGSYRIPGVKESALISKLRKLSGLGHAMLDISTMPADTLVNITESWQRQHHGRDDVTIVAIGHTKNFSQRAAREFAQYLQWAKTQGHQFTTYQQWLQKHSH